MGSEMCIRDSFLRDSRRETTTVMPLFLQHGRGHRTLAVGRAVWMAVGRHHRFRWCSRSGWRRLGRDAWYVAVGRHHRFPYCSGAGCRRLPHGRCINFFARSPGQGFALRAGWATSSTPSVTSSMSTLVANAYVMLEPEMSKMLTMLSMMMMMMVMMVVMMVVTTGTVVSSCCLLYTSPSPRDGLLSRMPSSA